MVSRKRKQSEPDSEGHSAKKRLRSVEDDDDDSYSGIHEEALVKRLCAERLFTSSQTPQNEREAGIIEQIRLVNFMTHGDLNCDFGNHVNFIIGQNSSGKSSLLTAVMVGLGGRAALTSRGNSVKNLIKHGKRTAEVSIRLRNVGADAYRHDVYGDSIVVVRKLAQDNAKVRSYRICDCNDRVVSTKREELDTILDYFNIQVDNPIVILNQEASKEFLISKTAQDMYRFFLRSTQLELINIEYQQAEESQKIATGELQKKKSILPIMETEVKRWQQRYNACTSLDKLREKIERLKEEMAWAFVCEKEKALEGLAKELKVEEVRTPKFVQKVDESQKKLEAKKEEHVRVQNELKAAGDEATKLEPQLMEKKVQVDADKQAAKSAADAVRRIQNELHGIVTDRRQIVVRIDEIRSSTQIDYAAVRREREQNILRLEDQVKEDAAHSRTLEFSADQFRRAVAKSHEAITELKTEEREVQRRHDTAEKKVKELQSSRSNNLRRFAAWMPELVRRVEEAYCNGHFHARPRGPIGANMKLKDPQWALAVEKCLGPGLLNAFCVNDYHDEKVFEQIAEPVCRPQAKPSTVTCKFLNTRHRVPQNPHKYPTVLEVLDISDAVVANCIIDQRRLEFVLLCENNAQATSVMLDNPPANYIEMFAMNGNQYFSRPCFRSYPSRDKTARFLTADVEQLIRDGLAEKERFSAELRDKVKKITDNEHSMKKSSQELAKTIAQQQKVQKRISDAREEIKELKNTEDPAPVDVRTLEDEVTNFDKKIADLQTRKNELTQKADETKVRWEAMESGRKDIEDRIRIAAQKLDPYREKLARMDNEVDRARQEFKHYKQKMKEFEEKLADIRKRHTEAEKEVEEATSKASQICAKIRVRRTAQNIESEITQIQRQINIEQRNRGDQDEIRKTYMEKKERFESLSHEVFQLSCFLEKLVSMLSGRQRWYKLMLRSLTLQLQCNFYRYVCVRPSFSGKLAVSHPRQTIVPVLQTDTTRQGDATVTRTNRSLSGGERSFATACFILALWDVMDSPFRCLDEFDVFMDLVNRRMCMEMMLKAAQNKRNCQYMFLSPQNMSDLDLRKYPNVDLKVLEMAPPRDEPHRSKRQSK